MTAIYPVILCGGAGVRLWPASRPDRPKQFLKLLGAYSSFQETLLRVKDLAGARELVVVTGEAMAPFVLSQAEEIGCAPTILIEPEARDSAPAVAAAAAYVRGRDPDGVVLMLASDHHIADPELFRSSALVAAAAAEQGLIVTFGVKPTAPATGFGYIRPGAPISDGVFVVAAFVEKPDLATAQAYVADGYLWNSGNFAFQAKVLMDELVRFEPSVAEGAAAAVAAGVRDGTTLRLDRVAFGRAAKISIDYAVMERTDRAAVAPAAFRWSDLGAWDAIWEAAPRDALGNSAHGDVALVDSRGVLIRSNGPFVGAIGVDDLMIVAEADAVLICRRGDSQAVKALVDGLKAAGRGLATRHVASQAGGIERRTVAETEAARVELWRFETGATADLPVGSLQVLAGALDGADGALTAGDRRDLTAPEPVTAGEPTSVMITFWR
ncbi:MAG: mannose-phosphate guanylyltransferase/mannose-6-phosphate isomerase [Caulobacter sp.]|nr:mannose-phosphate guanylyltransferase/mannose-6-phosphate isomerase [Caulobacter sp.]